MSYVIRYHGTAGLPSFTPSHPYYLVKTEFANRFLMTDTPSVATRYDLTVANNIVASMTSNKLSIELAPEEEGLLPGGTNPLLLHRETPA